MADPSIPKSTQCVLIFPFTFPKTKKIAFHNTFRTDDPASKDNLTRTSTIRDEVVNALENGNSSTIIAALERYLPQLFGLVVSVEENQKLRLNSPLSFSWTSSFANKSKSNFFTCYTYRFEVVMTVFTYGLAHINRASDTLAVGTEGSFDEDSKKAAALLRQAAGIFEYIQTRELPRWLELPPDRPLEVNSNICQVLSDFCIATAQSISIKKGLLSGTTSKSVLSKLSVDVWNKYMSVENTFKPYPAFKDVNPSWRAFLTVAQGVLKASTYKYLGQAAYEQGKYGMAVSLLNVAEASLKTACSASNIALLPKLKLEISQAQDDIEHIKRSYNNENNNIYFQPLIDESQLEIPEAKCLLSATAWVPPPPAFKNLI